MYFVNIIRYTFSILEIYNLTSFFRVEILIQIHIYIYNLLLQSELCEREAWKVDRYSTTMCREFS